jgi:autotransporter-associated beta strand protein
LKYEGDSTTSDRAATLVSGDVTVDVSQAAADLQVGGPLAGGAQLVKAGNGRLTLTAASSYSGGVILSNGVLALGANSANNSAGQSGLGLTNNTVTFRGGTLQLFGYDASTGNNYNTVYNPLVVPAGQTGTLRLFPRGPANSGANSGLASSLTGGGTLNLVVNYVRDNLSGDWSGFTGLINASARNASGDEMRINNDFGYANASIFLNDNVTLTRADTHNTVNNIGELGGSTLAVVGPGNSTGTNTTWVVGAKNTTQVFAGTISGDNNVVKVGTGRWVLTGQNTLTGSITISNGVLALGDGVTDGAILGGTIKVVSGAFLDASALVGVPGTLGLYAGVTLEGNGTLLGALDTSFGGIVAPGLPTGTLTVTNTVTLGGVAQMRLDRNASPNCGKLSAPAINLGGTLVATNIGARLQPGDTFDLFDGSLSGSFYGSVVLPSYYTWNTSNLEVNGTISVASVLPGPSFTSIARYDANYMVVNAMNGLPNGPLDVLTSTNLALPLNQWTFVNTTYFDGSGNLVDWYIPVDPAASQQFFMILAY